MSANGMLSLLDSAPPSYGAPLVRSGRQRTQSASEPQHGGNLLRVPA